MSRIKETLLDVNLLKKPTYGIKEKIDIRKRFWWEKLPILKNLTTKRAFAKGHNTTEVIMLELLDYLKLDIKDDPDQKRGFKIIKKKK